MEHRQQAHFQGKEPLLEATLRKLRLRKIIKHIPPHSIVVDLGCGYDAGFLFTIQPLLQKGVGIDLSVGTTAASNIELMAHNLNERLPLGDNEFDVAVSMANLEHLEQPQQLLNEVWRILKPGGKLVLTTPSIYAKPVLEFLAFRLHIVSAAEIRDHKTYFNKALLEQYLTKAGFQNIQHRYFQGYMNNFVLAIKD